MDHSALTPAAPRGASFKLPHPNRRTLVKGVAWSVPTIAISSSAAVAAVSPPGAAGCYPEGTLFNAQAQGRLISGAIGGINLDTIAEVEGVHARAFDPLAPGADGTASDVKVNPLSVTALNAITLNLGGLTGALSTVLDLTAGQSVGVINQYAEANAAAQVGGNGDIGASGTVSGNGTLQLETGADGSPSIGTLNLKSILEEATELQGVSDLVGSVADLTLDIGAVGGRSRVDSLCIVPAIGTESQVDRDYALAHLKVNAQSETLGGILGAVTGALPESALTLSTSAVLGLLDDVPIVGDILKVVSGSLLDVGVTADFSQLAGDIPTASGSAIQLNTGSGGESPTSITIDLAALLGEPYTEAVSPWLNELDPNTRLFVDAGLPADAVTNTVDSLVDSLVERVGDFVSISISLGDMRVTGLEISGTLNEFLNGTATAQYKLTLASPIRDMEGVTNTLQSIGALLENTVNSLINENQTLQTALEAVNAILSPLFNVLSGVVAITVNAQNNIAGGTMPDYYAAINNPGQFHEAAIHIEVLDNIVSEERLLNLSLGRGIVGEKTARS